MYLLRTLGHMQTIWFTDLQPFLMVSLIEPGFELLELARLCSIFMVLLISIFNIKYIGRIQKHSTCHGLRGAVCLHRAEYVATSRIHATIV